MNSSLVKIHQQNIMLLTYKNEGLPSPGGCPYCTFNICIYLCIICIYIKYHRYIDFRENKLI